MVAVVPVKAAVVVGAGVVVVGAAVVVAHFNAVHPIGYAGTLNTGVRALIFTHPHSNMRSHSLSYCHSLPAQANEISVGFACNAPVVVAACEVRIANKSRTESERGIWACGLQKFTCVIILVNLKMNLFGVTQAHKMESEMAGYTQENGIQSRPRQQQKEGK